MGKFARSKALAMASWSVLKTSKQLIWLPIISMIATLVTIALFAAPIWTSVHTSTDVYGTTHSSMGPVGWVFIALLYFAMAYISIFFNTALIVAADEKLRGGNPTLDTAIGGAMSRAGAILPWAIVSATVSVILRGMENRAGLVGRIAISLVGMAWSVVTFLVLPILVFEKVGVVTAVKRSATLLKKTWGENLIVNAGVGLIGVFGFLVAVPVVILCIATGSVPVIVAGVAAAALWMVLIIGVVGALHAIFQVALYRYAVEGQVPAAFAGVDLNDAFRARGGRFGRGGGTRATGPTPPPLAQGPGYGQPGYGQAPGGYGQPGYGQAPGGYGQPPQSGFSDPGQGQPGPDAPPAGPSGSF